MPSPSKKPSTNLVPVPGTIVWVRRRNGSWWPGQIISKKELLGSNVLSPRSGTPVKLLGREDASVDWYNIEKSKRVKAFRCGEFDECIQKAQTIIGMQSKRREKYARREDAIVDALELEREQEQLQGNGGKKLKKGKQKNAEQGKNASADGVRKYARKNKVKTVKERDTSDFEDGATLLPRMRGLQDLVSAGASKASSLEMAADGSSEASLLDDPQQSKAMKRKRSSGKAGEEVAAPKRSYKKRNIQQVLGTLDERDGEPGALEEDAVQVRGEGESEKCESTLETQVANKSTGCLLDAQSVSNSSKQGIQQQLSPGEANLQNSTCTTEAPLPPLQNGDAKPRSRKAKSRAASDKAGRSRSNAEHKSKGRAVAAAAAAKSDAAIAEDAATPGSPPLASDAAQKAQGPVHPRTRFEKQPVPMVSLLSLVTENPVYGYPVSVDVVTCVRKRRYATRSEQPAWQAAKRKRTPRPGGSGDDVSASASISASISASQQRRSGAALSKKLLKKAVMSTTSKKIRTLASISEGRRGSSSGSSFKQPVKQVKLEAPRWPVATLVPVSVALSRLRAVVSS